MKSQKCTGSVEANNLSIPDAEEIIEEALTNWRPPQTRHGASLAISGASGLPGIVELCAKTAAASGAMHGDAWTPEEDEVHLL